MILLSYFFHVVIFLFLLSPYHIVYGSPQKNEAIYNGFKQFLGTIYHYKCVPLNGGLSKNMQYICRVNGNKYVVRMLNEPLPIRKSEIYTHLLAARQHISPHIYFYDDTEYSFVIMDFIEGQTLLVEQASEKEILDLIAQKVRSIAQLDANELITTNKKDVLAETLFYYKKIKEKGCFELNLILEEALYKAGIVYKKIESECRPLVFSHNDLHVRNIFFIHDDIMVIDWETGAINYEWYDLANYSVYSCLHEADEHYLLSEYLQRFPTCSELRHFEDIKLLVKVFNAFGFLICLDGMPQSVSMESIKDFTYYAHVFAQDTNANNSEFLYSLGMSLLQDFFEGYKDFEMNNQS